MRLILTPKQPLVDDEQSISFGLFAPANYTVVVSLFVAAAAACGAIFLMIEMYYPYGGLIQVSSAPLRAVLEQIGR